MTKNYSNLILPLCFFYQDLGHLVNGSDDIATLPGAIGLSGVPAAALPQASPQPSPKQ